MQRQQSNRIFAGCANATAEMKINVERNRIVSSTFPSIQNYKLNKMLAQKKSLVLFFNSVAGSSSIRPILGAMITFRIKYGTIQATPTTRPPTTCFATAGSSKILIGAASAAKALDESKKAASKEGNDSITLEGIDELLRTSGSLLNRQICVGISRARLGDLKILDEENPLTSDSNDRAATKSRLFDMVVVDVGSSNSMIRHRHGRWKMCCNQSQVLCCGYRI